MKNQVLILLLCAISSAHCYKRVRQEPIYSKPSANNEAYKVEYLFEHDGCKVYRFQDMGNWVYFTSCQGEAITQDTVKTTRNRTERKQ